MATLNLFSTLIDYQMSDLRCDITTSVMYELDTLKQIIKMIEMRVGHDIDAYFHLMN